MPLPRDIGTAYWPSTRREAEFRPLAILARLPIFTAAHLVCCSREQDAQQLATRPRRYSLICCDCAARARLEVGGIAPPYPVVLFRVSTRTSYSPPCPLNPCECYPNMLWLPYLVSYVSSQSPRAPSVPHSSCYVSPCYNAFLS